MIKIELDGNSPAIVPYDEDVHAEHLQTTAPVLKVEFDFTSRSNDFERFVDVQCNSLQLAVAASEVRNLQLSTDSGIADATKPFHPFGAQPKVNASWLIGSTEIFSKALDGLELHPTWEALPDGSNNFWRRQTHEYKVTVDQLVAGVWTTVVSSGPLFGDSLPLGTLEDSEDAVNQSVTDAPFSTATTAGFVRLQLMQDFGHADFPREYTKAAIALAKGESARPQVLWIKETAADAAFADVDNYVVKGPDPVHGAMTKDTGGTLLRPPVNFDGGLPMEPLTPTITGLSASYRTKPGAPEELIHLYPFGHKSATTRAERLFPELPHEGELYIGVRDLDPPQRLAMLFQTADGTANPLKGRNDVGWDYLEDNHWRELEDREVSDLTNDLTGSGIVGIAVPKGRTRRTRCCPTVCTGSACASTTTQMR